MTKPQQTSKKQQAPFYKRFYFPRHLQIGLVIFVLLCGIFSLYVKYQHTQEAKEYVRLEQILQGFSDKANSYLGRPVRQETKSYCRHNEEKFSTGLLYCGVRTGANYAVDSKDGAKQLGRKIETLIKSTNLHDVQYGQINDRSADRWFSYYYFKVQAIKATFECSLDMAYINSGQGISDLLAGESKDGTFGYIIRCTRYTSHQALSIGQ